MRQPAPSINVYDEIPTDVSSHALQSILSFFGIQERFDGRGNRTWTIDIQRDATVGLQQEAIFETSTRSWRLHDTYRATDVMRNPARSPPLELTRTTTSTTHLSDANDVFSAFDGADWVNTLPKTSHAEFFRSIDWSNTLVGRLDSWPKSLRFYTHMVLSQTTPAAVYWGPDYVSIYNESFIPLVGKAHPKFMGAAFFDIWEELRSSFTAIFDQIRATGVGIDLTDYNLFLDRNNYTEETWWRGNLFPLAKEDGSLGGSCFMWNEVTRQVLADRRTKLLNDLGQFDINAEGGIWTHIRKTLRRNPRDIAMAILYSSDEVEVKVDRILRSEGAIGIGTDHVAAPSELNLDKSMDGFAPVMRAALESPHGWISVNRDTENFPSHVLGGIDWQGYGEHSKELVIIPLEVVNNYLKGFIIMGMNPRRAFDADHRQFVTDMQRQLITLMTSVTTQEQARQRETKLMADLADSERRIRHLAELAPMGLFDLSAEGQMRWANSHYFSIMGIERPKNITETAWINPVDPADLPRVEQIFKTCIENDTELAGTVRLSRKWQPPKSELDDDHSEANQVHVYFQAFSYKEAGVTTSIMGSVTDVSRFVWAESVQAKVADNAKRARQRQEEFIDIVSHELRNPLSAVTQCADGIIQSLRDYGLAKDDEEIQAIIESCTDAADSILLCAAHQKRIVDDVLTLSKLDSDLITLAPSKFQPVAIQKEAMQMFQSEFTANNIEIVVHPDHNEIGRDAILICDPSRVSQILVNLITNAIKFQKKEGEHVIEIRYGVDRDTPPQSKFGSHFRWSESHNGKYVDVTSTAEYGSGEEVYLYFSVKDTGQGLPSEKAVQIFDKFIQASRRTHVKYGGSGLGLYISRQLAEIQGGRIGVESEDGVGSTFAFYVKAKRATAAGSQSLSTRTRNPVLPVNVKFEILLVEDNLVNQKVLAKQLRKAGCTVHIANHGGEAVDFMLNAHGQPVEYGTTGSTPPNRLDCILMDWEMPVLDGLAATERIRNLEKQGIVKEKHIILGVTANARSEQINTAMKAGMDAVVTKPFRVPDLTARIHDLLASR